jgi:hypothetical protein
MSVESQFQPNGCFRSFLAVWTSGTDGRVFDSRLVSARPNGAEGNWIIGRLKLKYHGPEVRGVFDT